MIIHFSPQRRDDTLEVSRSGDTIVINEESFDFSAIPEGATLPVDAIESDWFAGPVERIDGVLRVTLILPHGPDPSQDVAFPAPKIVTANGPIEIPE